MSSTHSSHSTQPVVVASDVPLRPGKRQAPKLKLGSTADRGSVDLSGYQNTWYNPGRSRVVRILWYLLNAIIFINPLMPLYGLKRRVLRLFGAKIGKGVVIKPNVNIKYPWNLEIGDHTWIGERSWFDSLEKIKIGANVCVSQGVYLCTGSHDWKDPTFSLIIKPIVVEDGAWLGCQSTVTGGVVVGSHSVVAAGSVASQDLPRYMICRGNPAKGVKPRNIHTEKPKATNYRMVFPEAVGEQSKRVVAG